MEPRLKGCLKAIVLELRRELEGSYDAKGGWQPGDLERRLAAVGVRKDRAAVPVDELPHLSKEDREARRVVDALLMSRADAGLDRDGAVEEFVRQSAYTWTNRLLALRCMEARGLIDEVILQKEAYGGRSLQHNRVAKKTPERCSGEDEGLFATLFDEFERRARELPLLFSPKAPEVALRPSVPAIKRCVGLLSGTTTPKGQEPATDVVFTAPDALGWAYQYWNTDEKDRVFEKVRTKKGAKIEGAEIIPATCIYTEPYIVRFLVQNSLGALWMGMRPGSKLADGWEYYVRDADRAPIQKKHVRDITFLDPACGSGHFLIEAFDLFYAMYEEEGEILGPAEICAAILERNLHGIDIDERAVQIAALALVMKAKEKAPDFVPRRVNLVATNIRLPAGKDQLEAFLRKHPDDTELKPALLAIFEGLAHADELGSLLQIEEPVERELKHIRGKLRGQLTLTGPKTEEDWASWKSGVIERLRQHFDAEADAPDLVTALFGEAGARGLSLVDLLARRYDLVAANPPYMGSRNMASVVKKHVERHFSAGKRDLYAAFILRCLELAAGGSRVAMVVPESWMFLRSFADLRASDDGERGVLGTTRIETLAQLGRHAFSEADPPSNVVLITLAACRPTDTHRVSCSRLSASLPAEEQGALLRAAVAGAAPSIYFRPVQRRFLTIPQAPVCYWLRESLLNCLSSARVGSRNDRDLFISEGIGTRAEHRFLRHEWEVASTATVRWFAYSKGGGYARWGGFCKYRLDWEGQGRRVKSYIGEHYPPDKFTLLIRHERLFGKDNLTFSSVARGSLGVRRNGTDLFSDAGPGIFWKQDSKDLSLVALILNCRLMSYLARALSSGGLSLNRTYVEALPVTKPHLRAVGQAEKRGEYMVVCKRALVSLDPTERGFGGIAARGASLKEAWRNLAHESEAVAAVLHALEGLSEREVFAAYGIAGDDLQAVLHETGTPAGWFPLVAGYDTTPQLPEGVDGPRELLAPLVQEPRRTLAVDDLADLKRRLRVHYEAGPGATIAEDEGAAGDDNGEDENEASVSGARIPIPVETFVEELAQKSEVHPITVCWLLRELRDKESVVCGPELRRFVEDYASVLVLRLLGHRWPREVEAGEVPPPWADRDGIVPLTDGTGEPTMFARVRERVSENFGAERASAIEREFEEIVGKPLSSWLASDFFRRHISQFRKRPIAWQITSSPGNNERRRGRGVARSAPVFSCLVYYHRLDADLLPKLRSQYVGPLRLRFQTELAGLEKVRERTADQDAQRVELETKIEELKAFDARIEEVIVRGFDCAVLAEVVAKELLDKWTSRDGHSPHPSTRDAFLDEERRYAPDLNDGVRVNVAPLQRAGLLAADVLASKDVEKAISDRAEWRADERRWCREGKLPRPGWWPHEKREASGTREVAPPSATGSNRR